VERRKFIQQAAAIGFGVTSPGWEGLFATPLAAAEVRGHVVAEGQPIAGVRVSDATESRSPTPPASLRFPSDQRVDRLFSSAFRPATGPIGSTSRPAWRQPPRPFSG